MKRLSPLIAAVALAVAPGAAHAVAVELQYLSSYNVMIDPEWSAVTNIVMFEDGGTTWAFEAYPGEVSVLNNPFPKNVPNERSLLIGITQDLPGDAEGQKHVVLLMDDTAASLAESIAWGTLFPNTLEDSLIAAIELATSGGDWEALQPAFDELSEFVSGDAETGILDGLAQPHSAWFTMGDNFSVLTWSDGTRIGWGTSTLTPVPEPTTSALLLSGMLALGAVARRRTR